MDVQALILSDLRTCLAEGKKDFEILVNYRGVQFVGKAIIKKIQSANLILEIQGPCTALIEAGRTAVLLTDGLLDPVRFRVMEFKPISGLLEAGELIFAGAHVGSRHEYRVEPCPHLPAMLVSGKQELPAELADIALGGAGLHLPDLATAKLLARGQDVLVRLALPEGQAELPAVIRSLDADSGRLAVEFTENVPGKTLVLRYITRCMADIRHEVQERYEKQQRSLASNPFPREPK